MQEKRLRLTVDFMLLIVAMEQDDIEEYYRDRTEAGGSGAAPRPAPRPPSGCCYCSGRCRATRRLGASI